MIILRMGKGVLRAIYGLHKLAPTRQNRITMISRQGDAPGIDFVLLRDALLRQDPEVDVRFLCKRLDGGLGRKVGYLFHMVGPQMHALATSKVVVLDSYCIAVSILNHKPELTIVQMWHAMGALKKFAKSILDLEEGSSSELARVMQMHEHYDILLASSEQSAEAFSEAFGYPKEAFTILSLPRADLLRDAAYMDGKREEILAAHPELVGQKVVLYAPTFRKGQAEDWQAMERFIDEMNAVPGYRVVLAPHPAMTETAAGSAAILREYTTLELLSIADFFVTDYSAMLYEAALAGKPIFLYAYDKDRYVDSRGFYLDYERDLPATPLADPHDVVAAITRHDGQAKAADFVARAISDQTHCADALAGILLEQMNR